MLIIGLCHGTPPQEPPWETPSGTPCPRVRLAYSLRQLRVVYHLTTPSILKIVRATSCRLLEYIRSVATVPRSVTLGVPWKNPLLEFLISYLRNGRPLSLPYMTQYWQKLTVGR